MQRSLWHRVLRLLLVSVLFLHPAVQATEGIRFWEEIRKGANCFNREVDEAYFIAAKELGLDYIRLVPDKWRAAERDFLIGNCDEFSGINEVDFAELIRVLDLAHKHGQHIVLGMLSLPGCRWVQLNNDQQDYRLWQDDRYQKQAVAFWRELAGRLKDHPAIVAFNPLNEPHPELADDIEDLTPGTDGAFVHWLERHRHGAADLQQFNRQIVEAIRQSCPDTPVLLEGYQYGSASGLTYLNPVDDAAILYSFHFYEPYNYTASRANQGKYRYPDKMPEWWNGPPVSWTKDHLRQRMEPVMEWSIKNGIPSHRIVVAEFGCERLNDGAERYLEDVIDLLNSFDWHWAFYSFREDVWQAMDYELGQVPTDWTFWKTVKAGEVLRLYEPNNAIWTLFRRQFDASVPEGE